MATHINEQRIDSSYSSPDISYGVTYTATRKSNSQVTYKFTIKTYLVGSSSSWFGNGYELQCSIKVNGVTNSVKLKTKDEVWTGGSSSGTLKSTDTLSITCGSTTANAQQTVTFQVTRPDGYGDSGKVSTTNYYVKSPALLPTACSAPTSFTATPSPFIDNVTLSWSGASNGVNNTISTYLIRYATSSNGSTWSDYKDLVTDAGSPATVNMSSKVTNNHYVKFAIQSRGSAGSSYYSGWKYSNAIQRISYTKCTAPTTFTITSDSDASTFNNSVTLKWSDAKGGTNNSISSYLIRYTTSSDNSTWSDYADLSTVSLTSASGSKSIDISSKVGVGKYVKFAIRTRGSAGSSYYSEWKYSSSIQRKPYSQCGKPTSLTISPSPFDNKITLKWSGATNGNWHSITSYHIQYRVASSKTGLESASWVSLGTINITSTSGSYEKDMSSVVTRGNYIQFGIRTQTSSSTYYSDYYASSSTIVQRKPYTKCTAPTSFTISTNNFNNNITLNWSGAIAGYDNEIQSYEIQYSTSSDNSTWTSWKALDTVSLTSVSGNKYIDMSAKVTRGHYVKCQIRVCGSAGSDFYSGWKSSNSIKRNPYTACTEPKDINCYTVSDLEGWQRTSNFVFKDNIIMTWTEGTAGENQTIKCYKIFYQKSTSPNVWGNDWTVFDTTMDGGVLSYYIDLRGGFLNVSDGEYIRFSIQTISSAGSNYDSDLSEPSIPMKKRVAPSKITEATITPAEFSYGDDIIVSWKYNIDNVITDYTDIIRRYMVIGKTKNTSWTELTYIDPIVAGVIKNGDTISLYITNSSSDNMNRVDNGDMPEENGLSQFYDNIEDESGAEISIIPLDMFDEQPIIDTTYVNTNTKFAFSRYDDYGIRMGIDNEWRQCQVYYGVNGVWVKCDIDVGLDGLWKDCGKV